MGLDLGKEHRDDGIKYLEKLMAPEGVTSFFSTGCYTVPMTMVASGKLHAYLGSNLEPWDMAAASLIMREAGAKVTNLTGRDWQYGDTSILASNPTLHNKLLNFLGI